MSEDELIEQVMELERSFVDWLEPTCIVYGCQSSVRSRGMCGAHYTDWWKRTRSTRAPKAHSKAAREVMASAAETKPVGSKRITADGYVEVKTHSKKWVAEHRVVMEAVLGRELDSGESVHHKNTLRDDNRPENLELWCSPGGQPRGGRVSDLVEWAEMILQRYG